MSKEAPLKQLLSILSLAVLCAACANSPGQTPAMQDRSVDSQFSDSSYAGTAVEINEEPKTCGRHSYPTYIDAENQKIINNDIESGQAEVILHFHNLGQATLDAFLARTEGVLEVDSQWPDWGAISITVNEVGLHKLSQDCAVRVIEANKREYPQ